MGERRELALQRPKPSLDFTRFPRRTLRAKTTRWFRQHHERPTSNRGAWYFAPSPDAASDQSGGRFDLERPHGTCYLASTPQGAINELIGPDCAARGWVDADLVSGRILSELALAQDVKAADTTSSRAVLFGLTNELAATDRYDITRAWAQTLHRAGFGALYSVLRFTPGATRALALFGIAGPPASPLPGDPSPELVRIVVVRLGIEVVDPPSFSAVRVDTP